MSRSLFRIRPVIRGPMGLGASRLVLLAIFGVFLSSGPASWAQPGDPHFVGDRQFGLWKLGMSEEEAVKAFTEMLGPHYSTGAQPNVSGARYYFWQEAGVKFVVNQQGSVIGIFAWRRYGSSAVSNPNAELQKYHTERGIMIGSTLSAVQAAYGPADEQWDVRWTNTFINTAMKWNKTGIYIEIHDGIVDALGVYEPTAWGS